MSAEAKKTYILKELKKNGCRITNQRKLLIDVILNGECSSCKEIYYQAGKEGCRNRYGDGLPHDQYAGRVWIDP